MMSVVVKGFPAGVLGGCTHVPEAILGGLFLGITENLGAFGLSAPWKDPPCFGPHRLRSSGAARGMAWAKGVLTRRKNRGSSVVFLLAGLVTPLLFRRSGCVVYLLGPVASNGIAALSLNVLMGLAGQVFWDTRDV
ncbi:MAG: hypothetical protein ACUVQS_05030 [Candidatus Bipolaricaulaceae bacterium]